MEINALKKLIKDKNFTIGDIAKKLNMSREGLSKSLTGNRLNVQDLSLIADILSVDIHYMIDIISGKSTTEEDRKPQPISLVLSTAEILPMKALAGDLVTDFLAPIEKEVVLMPHFSFRAMFIIAVEGDSMNPVIKPGERLIVTHVFPNEIEDNKIYIIHTREGETLVKRLIADHDRGGFMMISENRHYKNRLMMEGEVMNFFKVISRYVPVEEK